MEVVVLFVVGKIKGVVKGEIYIYIKSAIILGGLLYRPVYLSF